MRLVEVHALVPPATDSHPWCCGAHTGDVWLCHHQVSKSTQHYMTWRIVLTQTLTLWNFLVPYGKSLSPLPESLYTVRFWSCVSICLLLSLHGSAQNFLPGASELSYHRLFGLYQASTTARTSWFRVCWIPMRLFRLCLLVWPWGWELIYAQCPRTQCVCSLDDDLTSLYNILGVAIKYSDATKQGWGRSTLYDNFNTSYETILYCIVQAVDGGGCIVLNTRKSRKNPEMLQWSGLAWLQMHAGGLYHKGEGLASRRGS